MKNEWSNVDAWIPIAKYEYYEYPDIKTIIQEIIDRDGWTTWAIWVDYGVEE